MRSNYFGIQVSRKQGLYLGQKKYIPLDQTKIYLLQDKERNVLFQDCAEMT